MASSSVPLRDPSLASLRSCFDATAWGRGERYAADHRVADVKVADDDHAAIGWIVDAHVQGGERYDTWLDLGCDEQGRWWFAGGCSCPVQQRCKHLAALVQVLAQERPEIIPARPIWAGLGGGIGAGIGGGAGTALPSGHAPALGRQARHAPPTAPAGPPGGDRATSAARSADAGNERAIDRWFDALEAPAGGAYLSVPPVAENEQLYYVLSELPGNSRRSARLALSPMRSARLRSRGGEPGRLRELPANVRTTAAYSADPVFRDVMLAMEAGSAALRGEPDGCIDGLVGLALLERAVRSGHAVASLADGSPGEPWVWGPLRRLDWRWRQFTAPHGQPDPQHAKRSHGAKAPGSAASGNGAHGPAHASAEADADAPWHLVPVLLPSNGPGHGQGEAQAATPPAADPAPARPEAAPAGKLKVDGRLPALGPVGDGVHAARVLLGGAPVYTLPGQRVIGPLDLGEWPAARVERLLAAPALPDAWLRSRADQPRTRRLLPELPPGMARPVARRIGGVAPLLVIRLCFQERDADPLLLPRFDYDGVRGWWAAGDTEHQFVTTPAGLVDLRRETEAEAQLLARLARHASPAPEPGHTAAPTAAAAAAGASALAEDDDGFTRPGALADLIEAPARAEAEPVTADGTAPEAAAPLDARAAWRIAGEDLAQRRRSFSQWLADDFAALRAEGFVIEFERGHATRVREVDEVQVELGDPGQGGADDLAQLGDNGWLGLTMGFQLDGRRFNLLPWLPQLVAQVDGQGDTARRTRLWLHDESGQWWGLPSSLLAPWLAALVELVGERKGDEFHGPALRLSRIDALRLAADTGHPGALAGLAALREIVAAREAGSAGTPGGEAVAMPAPPEGLNATLRPYQLQGLAWLQALARHGLGGVLADDMGLGKTLQALAHLLAEKQRGALTQPALIVAPTSLVGNWRRECERFTPALSMLVLHGGERHMRFDDIVDHDIVLTTYPLLPRDGEVLVKQPWHVVVLDEAQTIKNTRTQAAQVVQMLRAQHRLCLSGTPMENHLGEVWSLFHFLMPGYLSSEARFRSLFRNPIERQRDGERLALLRRRLAPFMLRRTKDMVAAELPPKVETVVRVQMEPAQANLYETIRVSTEASVRLALAEKGLARSHITVLDALLKLRQVCCDPQLLQLEQARQVEASAKLDWLMETLPEMIEEGRRVLVFSQFTSMLERIEQRLASTGLAWTKLTGQSKQRDALVERFTSGEVPLFLISLKAGGVGLNLPQADTVIHYDPWWNPAVENQATDRAHRIGQHQTVFVYKLVAEGTLEERILGLQERKAELARGLHGSGLPAGGEALDAADIDWLLQPLGAGLDEAPRRR